MSLADTDTNKEGAACHREDPLLQDIIAFLSPYERKNLVHWIKDAPISAFVACFTVIGRLFTCSACHTFTAFGIMECVRGHIVCDACAHLLTECPVCERPQAYRDVRALEKAASWVVLPCDYRNSGCREFVLGDAWFEHASQCLHAPTTYKKVLAPADVAPASE